MPAGWTTDARLILGAEYRRDPADHACPMVPVGKVVATLPQRPEPSNRSNKSDRTPAGFQAR
jgi:hypothetical protein